MDLIATTGMRVSESYVLWRHAPHEELMIWAQTETHGNAIQLGGTQIKK